MSMGRGQQQPHQPHVEKIFGRAAQLSQAKLNTYVQLEHLAWALCEEESIVSILNNCGVDVQKIIEDLKMEVEQAPKSSPEYIRLNEVSPTATFIRVIQNSIYQAVHSGRKLVEPYHIMATLLVEKESPAAFIFHKHGIDRFSFLRGMHGAGTGGATPEAGSNQEIDPMTGMPKVSPEEALEKYCVNLNMLAAEGKIDNLIGRLHEVERTIQILCRRRKNNPLFVGEPGVGKTAIAEGLALKIVSKEVPEFLQDAVIYSLNMGALMAGTKYRGDMEERLQLVLDGIKKVNEDAKAVLFIDEIHDIIGAGATSGGSMDVGNLLKPALQKGELRCIGSTTYAEYRKYFEKDRALKRRFQKIDIAEPTVDEAKDILRGLSGYFAEHHGVEFSDESLERAVDLSHRHIHDNQLPDKAIDVIDEAGAAQWLLPDSEKLKIITPEYIETVVSKIARIPPEATSSANKDRIKYLERNTKDFVFGQDTAIETVVKAVKVSLAGMREPGKPMGNYLFSGPTGVGKTEVAKQLALSLGIELLRFDMSEYMEKHSVAKLIGSPPGYVGHDDTDGQLIEAIDQNPHAVLLLDEIEKAHPDVFNALLQVMDYGKLTSGRGKQVDFRQVIIIMTTNAGAADMQKPAMGFGNVSRGGEDLEAINKLFAPEFRNRLDAIVRFNNLQPEVMVKIVDKFINELQTQMDEKEIVIKLDNEAREWLAQEGYSAEFGARPLAKVISQNIKEPMADEILFGALVKGGTVNIGVEDSKLKLTYAPSSSLGEAKAEPEVL